MLGIKPKKFKDYILIISKFVNESINWLIKLSRIHRLFFSENAMLQLYSYKIFR